jgi:hypothetical protein
MNEYAAKERVSLTRDVCSQGIPTLAPISQQVLTRLNIAVGHMHSLSIDIKNRLEPICSPECPAVEPNDGACEQGYPEYFDQIRRMTKTLEFSIELLADTMRRCEI